MPPAPLWPIARRTPHRAGPGLLPRVAVLPPRAGFTLIELTVVMAVIAILFFALQPTFVGMVRGAQERAALGELVGLFNYARTEAVGSGRLVRVICEPREGLFWAEAQADPEQDRSQFDRLRILGRSEVRMSGPLTVAAMTVSGLEMADQPAAPVYFYPDGRTDGASLSLIDGAGRELTILLSSATGRVRIRG